MREVLNMKYTKEFLLERYATHGTLTGIAKELGVTKQAMYTAFKKRGIPVTQAGQVAKDRCSKYSYDSSFFSSIDSEIKAYWLGFLMADGCVTEKTRSYRLKLALKSSDKKHIEKFMDALKSNTPILTKYAKLNGKTYEYCQVTVNSTSMCKDLICLGVKPRKSMLEYIPDIPGDLIRHFIRGYFDGDGCATVHNERVQAKIMVGTTMELDLVREFTRAGIKLPPKTSYAKIGTTIRQMNITAAASILALYRYMYEDASVYLDRKKIIFDTYVKI